MADGTARRVVDQNRNCGCRGGETQGYRIWGLVGDSRGMRVLEVNNQDPTAKQTSCLVPQSNGQSSAGIARGICAS